MTFRISPDYSESDFKLHAAIGKKTISVIVIIVYIAACDNKPVEVSINGSSPLKGLVVKMLKNVP